MKKPWRECGHKCDGPLTTEPPRYGYPSVRTSRRCSKCGMSKIYHDWKKAQKK